MTFQLKEIIIINGDTNLMGLLFTLNLKKEGEGSYTVEEAWIGVGRERAVDSVIEFWRNALWGFLGDVNGGRGVEAAGVVGGDTVRRRIGTCFERIEERN